MARSRRRGAGGVFLILFGGFFLAITGVFDWFILQDALASSEARSSWPTVKATILSSEVEATSTSDGTSYSAKVRYAYEVDGRPHEGDRVRLGTPMSFGSGHAERVVDRFPAGAEVRAWVDPDDPTRAALDVEGMAAAPFMFVFLTPFHCVGLVCIFMGLRSMRARRVSEVVAKFFRVDTPDRIVVAKRAPHPVPVFLFTMLAITFVSTFVIGFAFDGDPETAVVQWVLGGGAAASAALALWLRHRARSPERTLDIDLGRRRYRYPADEPPISLADAPKFRIDSRATSVRVNDETIFRHFLEMEGADRRERVVFEFKGPERWGRELADELESRLA